MIAVAVLTGAAVTVAQRALQTDVPQAADVRQLSTIFREISGRALPSVVSIETVSRRTAAQPQIPDGPFKEFFRNDPDLMREFFRNQQPQRPSMGMGSGFVIDKSGIIMTNNHVVSGADQVKVSLHDGREFIAKEVKTDPETDIAIIRIDAPADLQAMRMGNSESAQIGDWVLAVGSPFELEFSVTAGIISAKQRGRGIAARESFLQTDAAINPGNSGGPLLNLDGEVIGINTAIASRSGGSDGIGFAIPISMAKWVSRQLIENGEVRRAFLGVGIQPVDINVAESFDAKVGEGALVTQIRRDGPAAKSDLQVGDIILDYAGKRVRGLSNLQGIVERLAIGKTHPMTILRKGKKQQIKVAVAAMPKEYFGSRTSRQPSTPPKNEPKNELGLEVRDLDADILERLDLGDEADGVIVVDVDTDGAAYSAGIRRGMIIQKVEDQSVSSLDDFNAEIKKRDSNPRIRLFVRIGNTSRFLVIRK